MSKQESKKYELLDDPHAIRLTVCGDSLKELFQHALGGMSAYLKPEVAGVKPKEFTEKHPIKVRAVDISSLLVEFLSTVIAESDMHNKIFARVRFRKFGENFLEGELRGRHVDEFDKEIQAVSYQDVDIKKNPQTGQFETTLVFEV